MNNIDYYPIPNLGSGVWYLQWGVRRRIYYGPDHLLVVDNLGFTEDYSRIYYQDIRSLQTVPSYRQEVMGAIYGVFLLLFAGIFVVCLFYPILCIIPTLLGMPFFILFCTNLFAGPSCICYLTTTLQTIRVPMPNRFNQVPIFLEFLRKVGVSQATG